MSVCVSACVRMYYRDKYAKYTYEKSHICASIKTEKYFSLDACCWKKQSVDSKTTDTKFYQKRHNDLQEKLYCPNVIPKYALNR